MEEQQDYFSCIKFCNQFQQQKKQMKVSLPTQRKIQKHLYRNLFNNQALSHKQFIHFQEVQNSLIISQNHFLVNKKKQTATKKIKERALKLNLSQKQNMYFKRIKNLKQNIVVSKIDKLIERQQQKNRVTMNIVEKKMNNKQKKFPNIIPIDFKRNTTLMKRKNNKRHFRSTLTLRQSHLPNVRKSIEIDQLRKVIKNIVLDEAEGKKQIMSDLNRINYGGESINPWIVEGEEQYV